MGELALRSYFKAVADARTAGDPRALKHALYQLSQSAMLEADRISEAA